MESHQCLWKGCKQIFENTSQLAHHVSETHHVPNERTLPTRMHYCYEHDLWCASDEIWAQHIRLSHFPKLNDYCGLIRCGGVVVIAAHCLICLGDKDVSIAVRFTQFSDANMLHQHMKAHLAQLQGPVTNCPHPRCNDLLDSENAFWEHAISVHSVPPFGPSKVISKRKTRDIDSDNNLACDPGRPDALETATM
jgi:hypothetical protein